MKGILNFNKLMNDLGNADPDDYNEWITMGLALKNQDEIGFGLWTRWSLQSDKSNIAEIRKKWHSFLPQKNAENKIRDAAPDLLEALEEVIKCEIGRRNDLAALAIRPKSLYKFSDARVAKAQAAIKLAKGE